MRCDLANTRTWSPQSTRHEYLLSESALHLPQSPITATCQRASVGGGVSEFEERIEANLGQRFKHLRDERKVNCKAVRTTSLTLSSSTPTRVASGKWQVASGNKTMLHLLILSPAHTRQKECAQGMRCAQRVCMHTHLSAVPLVGFDDRGLDVDLGSACVLAGAVCGRGVGEYLGAVLKRLDLLRLLVVDRWRVGGRHDVGRLRHVVVVFGCRVDCSHRINSRCANNCLPCHGRSSRECDEA
jgi:hypothetical protein